MLLTGFFRRRIAKTLRDKRKNLRFWYKKNHRL